MRTLLVNSTKASSFVKSDAIYVLKNRKIIDKMVKNIIENFEIVTKILHPRSWFFAPIEFPTNVVIVP